MIDVVTLEFYDVRKMELRAMHRLRYRVFKERLNWNVPEADGNHEERDEYDDLNPVYLLSRNDKGNVVGTLRLLPTTGPNMLRDTFPELLYSQPAPSDPRIWESSRFAVDSSGDRRNCLATLSAVTSELFCGAVETCMANRISTIVTVHDALFLRVMRRVGCRPKWTSKPTRIDKSLSMFSWIDTDQVFLDKLREIGGIHGSVIRSAPWPTTFRAA